MPHPNTQTSTSSRSLDLGAMSQRATETLRNAGKFELEVLAGAHEGAKIAVEPGTISIGSAKDNSIILFADDMAEKHVELVLPSQVMKEILVIPLQESVTLEDGSVVEVGQQARVDSGEVIGLGDAEVMISRIADPKSFVKPGIRILAFICIMAMVPLVYGLVSGMAVGVAGASSSVISAIETGISNQRDKFLGTPAESTKGQLEAFAWTTRTKLEDLKLNHRLRVSPSGSGSLRVYGNISDPELQRWTAFLQWYDSNAGFPPLIRDVNRTDVDRDLPQVNSVWMDGEPTVVFGDGTIASVGTQIKDGWKVVSISSENVTLERDGAYVSLTY